MILYHVTPILNHNGILAHGVDPACATGRYKSSWWVERDRLSWAITHVALRHMTHVSDLLSCVAERDQFVRLIGTRFPGVYRSNAVIHPKSYILIEQLILEDFGDDFYF